MLGNAGLFASFSNAFSYVVARPEAPLPFTIIATTCGLQYKRLGRLTQYLLKFCWRAVALPGRGSDTTIIEQFFRRDGQ